MENYIDIVLIIPLIWGLIRGLFKGFIMTVGSVIGFIIGFYVSNNYALSLSSYLQSWFCLSTQIAYVFAYLMIFLVVILSIFSISLLLEKTIKHISLGWLNKVIGAIVGCLKYALIVSLLLNLVEIIDEKVDIVAEETKQSSYMYKPLLQIVPAILPSITYYEDKKL